MRKKTGAKLKTSNWGHKYYHAVNHVAVHVRLADVKKDFVIANIDNGDDNIHVTFWKKSVVNKPEFDGRFFVKIFAEDNKFKNKLTKTPIMERDWYTKASTSLHYIEDTGLTIDDAVSGLNYNPDTTANPPNPKTKSHWDTALKFGSNKIVGRWFVDKASFAGKQSLQGRNYYYGNQTKWVGSEGGSQDGVNVYASDTTSNVDHYYYCPGCRGGSGYTLPIGAGRNNNIRYDDNLGTGKSTGKIGMKGLFTSGSSEYIDISYHQQSSST